MYEIYLKWAEKGKLKKKTVKNIIYQKKRKIKVLDKIQKEINALDDILKINEQNKNLFP